MNVVEPVRSNVLRTAEYLQEIDCRLATGARERDAIFRLRYRAYLRENAILPNPTGRLTDDYDRMENCLIFGLWHEDALLSSVRLHILSKEHFHGPALDVFPDIVVPLIERGALLVDPTRLVVDRDAARRYPLLPHLTVRIACMASEHFAAEYCLATVRSEHAAFYRRLFSFEQVCEPRPYPGLTKPICLMLGDMARIRDRVAARYPLFTSTLAERALLFERPALDEAPLQPTPAATEAADFSDRSDASVGESKALN
jgi:hypothetical protein